MKMKDLFKDLAYIGPIAVVAVAIANRVGPVGRVMRNETLTIHIL